MGRRPCFSLTEPGARVIPSGRCPRVPFPASNPKNARRHADSGNRAPRTGRCSMSVQIVSRVIVAALVAALTGGAFELAGAAEVGGGGSSRSDCLATFMAAVNTPAKKPRNIRIEDGKTCADMSVCDDGLCDDGSSCDIDG